MFKSPKCRGKEALNRRPYLVENTFWKKAADGASKGPGVGRKHPDSREKTGDMGWLKGTPGNRGMES